MYRRRYGGFVLCCLRIWDRGLLVGMVVDRNRETIRVFHTSSVCEVVEGTLLLLIHAYGQLLRIINIQWRQTYIITVLSILESSSHPVQTSQSGQRSSARKRRQTTAPETDWAVKAGQPFTTHISRSTTTPLVFLRGTVLPNTCWWHSYYGVRIRCNKKVHDAHM